MLIYYIINSGQVKYHVIMIKMRPQLKDVLRNATEVLCRELDPDNELRYQLKHILARNQLESVYVRIISIFIYV